MADPCRCHTARSPPCPGGRLIELGAAEIEAGIPVVTSGDEDFASRNRRRRVTPASDAHRAGRAPSCCGIEEPGQRVGRRRIGRRSGVASRDKDFPVLKQSCLDVLPGGADAVRGTPDTHGRVVNLGAGDGGLEEIVVGSRCDEYPAVHKPGRAVCKADVREVPGVAPRPH